MPWREARAKLDAHKRLKDALAAASRAVFSGAASVLRPASLARDVRTVGGDWRDDWLLVRVRGFAQCPNQISAHGQYGRVVVEKGLREELSHPDSLVDLCTAASGEKS